MTPTSSEQPPATMLRPIHQTARRTAQRQRLRAVSYPSPSPTAAHGRATEQAAEQAVSALTVSPADVTEPGTRGSKRWGWAPGLGYGHLVAAASLVSSRVNASVPIALKGRSRQQTFAATTSKELIGYPALLTTILTSVAIKHTQADILTCQLLTSLPTSPAGKTQV